MMYYKKKFFIQERIILGVNLKKENHSWLFNLVNKLLDAFKFNATIPISVVCSFYIELNLLYCFRRVLSHSCWQVAPCRLALFQFFAFSRLGDRQLNFRADRLHLWNSFGIP